MKTLNYDHKPQAITSPIDLIQFVKGIPAKFWCVDMRDNYNGRHCVLGHLDKAYNTASFQTPTDGFSQVQLANVNNGFYEGDSRKIDGASIKRRLLEFLKKNIDRKQK